MSLLLAMVMLLATLPLPASAAEAVAYLDANGNTQACSGYTLVGTDNTLTENQECYQWGTSGKTTWYVARGDVTLEKRADIRGDVHLILTDGCSLVLKQGIDLFSVQNELTIYGQENHTGRLTATGDAWHAGIGTGGGGTVPGNLTINGGDVTATGGFGSAGIGGEFNIEEGAGGEVTINGGSVKATGSTSGAGIEGPFKLPVVL